MRRINERLEMKIGSSTYTGKFVFTEAHSGSHRVSISQKDANPDIMAVTITNLHTGDQRSIDIDTTSLELLHHSLKRMAQELKWDETQ